MSSLSLVLDPDPRLRTPSQPVVSFDRRLAGLAEDMLACMVQSNGVGLAAVQIGRLERMFVANFSGSHRVFINPEVVSTAEWFTATEGCLSIPGKTFHPRRPALVLLRWQDLDGRLVESPFAGLSSHIIAHELDHLDGILAPDRCAMGVL